MEVKAGEFVVSEGAKRKVKQHPFSCRACEMRLSGGAHLQFLASHSLAFSSQSAGVQSSFSIPSLSRQLYFEKFPSTT